MPRADSRPWLRYPGADIRPPLTCPTGRPRFRTAVLARASIPSGVPVSTDTVDCDECPGWHRVIDQAERTEGDHPMSHEMGE